MGPDKGPWLSHRVMESNSDRLWALGEALELIKQAPAFPYLAAPHHHVDVPFFEAARSRRGALLGHYYSFALTPFVDKDKEEGPFGSAEVAYFGASKKALVAVFLDFWVGQLHP